MEKTTENIVEEKPFIDSKKIIFSTWPCQGHGLGNQLMSLYAFFSLKTKDILFYYPALVKDIRGLDMISFWEVFEAEHFRNYMESTKNLQFARNFESENVFYYIDNCNLFGYVLLKIVNNFKTLNFAKELYDGLKVIPKYQDIITKIQNSMQNDYGCIHARIERDIYSHWYKPNIHDFLNLVSKDPYLKNSIQYLYFAVGKYIDPDDEILLNDKENQKKYNINIFRKNDEDFANIYIVDSLIDFSVCKEAKWYIGFKNSTFSMLIAEMRLRKQLPTFKYCRKDENRDFKYVDFFLDKENPIIDYEENCD